MQHFIGTKTLKATPMTRGEYNDYRGWPELIAESQTAPGYLVEYTDGGEANDSRHAGYITWSPKEVFDAAYRSTEGDEQRLTFGDAIHFAKQGQRVARSGWNGKGMFVWMNPGSFDANVHGMDTHVGGIKCSLFSLGDHGTTTRLPNMNMRAADGSTVTGWLASQTDMLAEDWCVLPPPN